MPDQPFVTHHLVASAQLNHHGTLFAATMAQWFVEASFMCASDLLGPEIVLVKLNGMDFTSPVHLGEVVRFESACVRAGRTSLTIQTRAIVGQRPFRTASSSRHDPALARTNESSYK